MKPANKSQPCPVKNVPVVHIRKEQLCLEAGLIQEGFPTWLLSDLMLWAIIFPSTTGIPFISLCTAPLGPMYEITVGYSVLLGLALSKDI